MLLDTKLLYKIIQESLPFFILVTVGELGAGVVLSNVEDIYALVPGLLTIIPAVLDMRGCISSALASRIGTGTHLGFISWDLGFNDELKNNIYAALLMSVLLSAVLGALGYFVSVILNVQGVSFVQLLLVSLIAGAVAGFMQAGITVFISLYAARRGIDPDNVTIPIVATLGDVISVLCIFLAVRVVDILLVYVGGI
ncbi:MAG: magnesium transporter [Candidatus Freyarchaeota archaeon]